MLVLANIGWASSIHILAILLADRSLSPGVALQRSCIHQVCHPVPKEGVPYTFSPRSSTYKDQAPYFIRGHSINLALMVVGWFVMAANVFVFL